MSYLVLARKWRPQGLDDLIGQEPITRILKNAISQNKIAHAYIFSGPRGVGKTSTARILAKALNCEHGPTSSPCGTCASCTAIKDGYSVDVLEIDGASNNSVDDIRDLREGVKYAPLGGRYKVYIIDESHMLSTSAFNALLKTLEEPPPHAVFVLATTAPKKIPATIFSRCQHLPFRRIPVQKIKDRLKHITASEAITITEPAIEMVARAADGSMRDSLTILDQVSSFSSDIKESEIKDLLGIADIAMLSEISMAIIDGDREKILKIIAELVDSGTDLKSFVKDLVGFFRDLLVAKIVRKPVEVLELGEDEMSSISGILPKASSDLLTLMLSEMVKAESDVRSAFSPRLSLEMSLIRASFLSNLRPVTEAIENIDAIVKGLSIEKMQDTRYTIHDEDKMQNAELTSHATRTVSGKEKIQEDTPLYPPLVRGDSKGGVHRESCIVNRESCIDGKSLMDAIREKVDDPLSSKLAKAIPSLDGNILVLTFSSSDEIFADSVRKNVSLIEGMASDIRKNPTRIKIETQVKKTVRKKDIKEKVLADPMIKEAIELFDGRIIDIKMKENIGG
ncbi:MAG: DNA polymerase III subunit gamma/tau [Nitrospirae bacterium]|nr:DNA polymerase III subunit gamma/tau [Nitrospirota bacterium]